MADLVPVPGRRQASGIPGTDPERRRGAWLRAAGVLVLLAGLALIVTLVVLLDPSAGAAGGCGGG
jgi:hypothetical protein